jgi:hypothetical protein
MLAAVASRTAGLRPASLGFAVALRTAGIPAALFTVQFLFGHPERSRGICICLPVAQAILPVPQPATNSPSQYEKTNNQRRIRLRYRQPPAGVFPWFAVATSLVGHGFSRDKNNRLDAFTPLAQPHPRKSFAVGAIPRQHPKRVSRSLLLPLRPRQPLPQPHNLPAMMRNVLAHMKPLAIIVRRPPRPLLIHRHQPRIIPLRKFRQ